MNYSDIMQCKPYDLTKMEFPCYGQVKMDGIFGRWDRQENEVYTRSGNIIQGLAKLKNELYTFPDYDGELVIPNMDFFTMNGLIRSSKETPNCVLYVFDQPGEGQTSARLAKYIEKLTTENRDHIHPLKYFLCRDLHEADAFYKRVLYAGYEGVVYKYMHSDYYNDKRWTVQKRTPEFTTECKIIGFAEGKNRLIGTLGAFLVNYKGISVRVGMGKNMDDMFRINVWDNQDKYLGQMLKVSYKSLTKKGSLRSPKYVAVRWDI